MPKPEWGVKRQCANCGARFYDLNADPATCPECGTVFEIEALIRGKRGRSAPREAVVTPDVEIDDAEIEGDDAVIEDDDDADVEEAAVAAPDEPEEDDLEPAEDVLLDDEVDADEDEDLGDFGGEEPDDDRR